MASSSRSRLQVDERRQQLLDLALELFGKQNYEEISIDAIAQAAGISKGLLYHYFPSKRAFYVAALREAARELVEYTDASADAVDATAGMPNPAQLRAGISTYLGYVEEKAVAYGFLLRGGLGSDPEVVEILDGVRSHFAVGIVEGLGSPPDTARLRVSIRGYMGLVEAASLDWIERGGMNRASLADLLTQMAVAILTAALTPAS